MSLLFKKWGPTVVSLLIKKWGPTVVSLLFKECLTESLTIQEVSHCSVLTIQGVSY